MNRITELEAGQLVALTAAPATDENGSPAELSGLFEIVEYVPREPAAYAREDGWLVSLYSDGKHAGAWHEAITRWVEVEGHDEPMWFVVGDVMYQQRHPQSYGDNLELERDVEMFGSDAFWESEYEDSRPLEAATAFDPYFDLLKVGNDYQSSGRYLEASAYYEAAKRAGLGFIRVEGGVVDEDSPF
jgi:hypothetical protein